MCPLYIIDRTVCFLMFIGNTCIIIWIFVYFCSYTSFSGLFPLLSRGTLPLVKVKEISQTIDSDKFTVQNSVQFASPLTTTSFITNGKFEVRSPRRVEVYFFALYLSLLD